MAGKGIIENPELHFQSMDYRSMVRRRGIFPTDIDGCYDLEQTFYMFSEAKRLNTPIKSAQRSFFEGLMRMINMASKINNQYLGVFIKYEHDTPVGELIVSAECNVTEIIDSETLKWYRPDPPETFLDTVTRYELKYDRIVNPNYDKDLTNNDKRNHRLKELALKRKNEIHSKGN
jgi:hypothetical protein